jgi:hypothetical protein
VNFVLKLTLKSLKLVTAVLRGLLCLILRKELLALRVRQAQQAHRAFKVFKVLLALRVILALLAQLVLLALLALLGRQVLLAQLAQLAQQALPAQLDHKVSALRLKELLLPLDPCLQPATP